MKKIVKLILIILWMLQIFSLSNDTGEKSTEKSNYIIVKIARLISNKNKNKEIISLVSDKKIRIVRKTAHFIMYFILGLLIISYLREYSQINYKSVLYAIGIVFIYACCDELHQLFVSGRSGEVLDVIIDTCGSILSCFIYYYIDKIRRIKHEQKKAIS